MAARTHTWHICLCELRPHPWVTQTQPHISLWDIFSAWQMKTLDSWQTGYIFCINLEKINTKILLNIVQLCIKLRKSRCYLNYLSSQQLWLVWFLLVAAGLFSQKGQHPVCYPDCHMLQGEQVLPAFCQLGNKAKAFGLFSTVTFLKAKQKEQAPGQEETGC